MMTSSPAESKRPWELHVIICLFLVVLGYAVAIERKGEVSELHTIIAAGVTVCMAGLFRGNRFAFWVMTVSFGVLSCLTAMQFAEHVSRYGFRVHRLQVHSATELGLSLATFGLLWSLKKRGAIPPRAAPLWDDAPALTKIAAVLVPVIILMAGISSLAIVALFQMEHRYSESYLRSSMKTLSSAEEDFRTNDRDGNGINDYWTGDVQGLYAIVPKGGAPQPIKLIEHSIAVADADPLKGVYPPMDQGPTPKGGAWFSALLEYAPETPPEPSRAPGVNAHRYLYAFIAYPDDFVDGPKYAAIVNESNTVFQRLLTGDIRGSSATPPGPLKLAEFSTFPSDADLTKSWQKDW